MTNYVNYFLTSKHSRLTDGHIKSEDLYNKILDHDGSTAFSCYFDLDEALLKYEWDTGKKDRDDKKIYEYHLSGQTPKNPDYKCNGKTFTKYEGICRPALGMVAFDFDSDGDPQLSLDDVRKFVNWIDADDVVTFFSGKKGFHVMVPFGYFDLEPNEHLPNQLKDLAVYLEQFYPTLDTSIYNYNRKFRVPFSKHEKSGLYKAALTNEYITISPTMVTIKELSVDQRTKGEFLPPQQERLHLQIFTEAIEESKRQSYEIEKDRAGSLDKPSPFEKYDNKLCIKKMLSSTCDDVGRNNACMRIVNDYYRTGVPQSRCEDEVFKWATNNALAASEVSAIINNIYGRGANYNFGCQDDCKSTYCSAKCDIWKKLAPDKRPITVDQPLETINKSKMKSEFEGVQWLMGKIFGCVWDDEVNEFTSGFIVKQDAVHLFFYKDNHWQHIDESKKQIMKTKLNTAYENKLGVRKLESIFALFILYVPEKPDDVDMFSPRNDRANFKDGTLHLNRETAGEFKLEFKEHNKGDYCTTMIDLKYQTYAENKLRRNDAFEDWLLDSLGGIEENFRLVQEMFAASIMPKFPQFFVLLGKTSTGKSTTIKVLKQLHKNDKNISGVSPDKFHGFHMASMIGKLINIVGDIKTNCKIDDDIVKQVDDQEVVRIEIKKKDDVYTKLPAVHIFGANKMPSTSEGYSGAMARRFSIINFDKQFTGKKNTEIAKDMFTNDPDGILAFTLRGLERFILEGNGEYTKSARSQENVDKWSKKSDVIWTFLNDIGEHSLDCDGKSYQLFVDKEQKILRSTIWKLFKEWQIDATEQRYWAGKTTFFNALEDAGFYQKRFTNGWFVVGIGELFEGENGI